MLTSTLLLLAGFVLVIAGGNYVTDGGVALARRFGVPPLVIGLTVVALGSATPDFVVSVLATVHGHTTLAVGDIVGADIFDMLLVAGVTAAITPVDFSRDTRRVDLPVLAVAGGLLFLFAEGSLLDGHGKSDAIGRAEGIAFLLVYGLFLYFTLRGNDRTTAPAPRPASKGQAGGKDRPLWLAGVMIAGGLAALYFGGNWIVSGATAIARRAGMSEAMIGLTVVAIGSSLPDLSTSTMAALKRQPGIAVGNLVGACIVDILGVLGVCSVIRPLDTSTVSPLNFAALLAAAVLLVVVANRPAHRMGRAPGIVLVLLYAAYMTLNIVFA